MPKLNLKPPHKLIRDYYATMQQYQEENSTHEDAVSAPFKTLLNILFQTPERGILIQNGQTALVLDTSDPENLSSRC